MKIYFKINSRQNKNNLNEKEKYIVRITGGVIASTLVINFKSNNSLTSEELYYTLKESIEELRNLLNKK